MLFLLYLVSTANFSLLDSSIPEHANANAIQLSSQPSNSAPLALSRVTGILHHYFSYVMECAWHLTSLIKPYT
ncbi:hypothetical protein BJ878DRAFT_500694 [Calycina marina]|uniref:Uncharacterized protein n=1 Tax=Calycina marina TaxID=1763456 RepID=A0A9P7Z5F8_9HELO|nr:hypothetical protein BJ878DRAFT_500694 [Calycina marina]